MGKSSLYASNSTYTLGTNEESAKALSLQQNFLEKDSCELLEKAKLSQGQVVWDIGCGNGCMTEVLSKKVGPEGHVYAIDVSSEMLGRANERIQSAHLNNVTFIKGDLTTMDFPKEKPDLIYSRFIFMHLQNPESVMRNVISHLKPGGVLTLQESALEEIGASEPLEDLDSFRDAVIQFGKTKGLDFNLYRS